MYTERQSQALFCWYGCFHFFFLPLFWLLLQNVPLLIQKDHSEKASQGRFTADAGHLCTDQARIHEVGAAEPPSGKPL